MEMKIRFPNMGFMFQYEDSAISVLGFEVTIYGLLITAGMLLGMLFIFVQARRQKQDTNRYLGAMIVALLGGVIGARLYYVAFSWEEFSEKSWKLICDISSGGMAIYGGILGGALLLALFCKIFKMSFGRTADTLCVGLLIGQIVGVWGNFFNRESFGEYTENVFAMRLPLHSVQSSAVTDLMMDHLVNIDGVEYIQTQPLFFYESIWCILLLIILLIYTARKKFQGEIFLRYLAGYGLGKCVIEWLRTDKLYISGTEIPISLLLSAALFLICGIMAEVRRVLWKQREKVRMRRQREEAEKKSETEDESETEEALELEEETASESAEVQEEESVTEQEEILEVSEAETEEQPIEADPDNKDTSESSEEQNEK